MKLDDNATYEAFQFWWYAIAYGPARPVVAPRLETEERLRQKLAAISAAHEGGGRVLREPCALEFSLAEVIVLADRMGGTPWTPEARPHAKAALEALCSG